MAVRFTAILSNYNHAAFVAEAIGCALKQTVPFDEIIIIDDASKDDSIAVIERAIAGVPQARLIKHAQNQGVVASLNEGVATATGDFVYLMAADDTYSPHIVEWCRDAVVQFPDVALIAGHASTVDAVSGDVKHYGLPFGDAVARLAPEMLGAIARRRNITFLGGANMIRREAIVATGGQLPELRWSGDWLLYLLITSRAPFAVVPREWVRMRVDAAQYSHAIYEWKTQGPVIAAFVQLLKERYPQDYDFFRRNALLPSYDVEALGLLLKRGDLRSYLTPLLVWRLVSYKLLRMGGRLLPVGLRERIRMLFRV